MTTDTAQQGQTELSAGFGAAQRAGEFLLFCSLIVVSSFAVAAVALAAPLVLAASALSALLPGKRGTRGWRPVTA